jgi:hypothetical protein
MTITNVLLKSKIDVKYNLLKLSRKKKLKYRILGVNNQHYYLI